MALAPGPIQEQWLQSLEQHPERQLKDQLGMKYDNGFYQACCLGELGLIAGVCVWDEDGELKTMGKCVSKRTLRDFEEEVGLYSSIGGRIDDTGEALALLNDEKMTWPEIAKHVRENFDSYFTKSV